MAEGDTLVDSGRPHVPLPPPSMVPPPPPLPGSRDAPPLPHWRQQVESLEKQQMANIPEKLISTLAKDPMAKKPFTYTPCAAGPEKGILDLSQIRSPKMKRRLLKNLEDKDADPEAKARSETPDMVSGEGQSRSLTPDAIGQKLGSPLAAPTSNPIMRPVLPPLRPEQLASFGQGHYQAPYEQPTVYHHPPSQQPISNGQRRQNTQEFEHTINQQLEGLNFAVQQVSSPPPDGGGHTWSPTATQWRNPMKVANGQPTSPELKTAPLTADASQRPPWERTQSVDSRQASPPRPMSAGAADNSWHQASAGKQWPQSNWRRSVAWEPQRQYAQYQDIDETPAWQGPSQQGPQRQPQQVPQQQWRPEPSYEQRFEPPPQSNVFRREEQVRRREEVVRQESLNRNSFTVRSEKLLQDIQNEIDNLQRFSQTAPQFQTRPQQQEQRGPFPGQTTASQPRGQPQVWRQQEEHVSHHESYQEGGGPVHHRQQDVARQKAWHQQQQTLNSEQRNEEAWSERPQPPLTQIQMPGHVSQRPEVSEPRYRGADIPTRSFQLLRAITGVDEQQEQIPTPSTTSTAYLQQQPKVTSERFEESRHHRHVETCQQRPLARYDALPEEYGTDF